MAYSNSVLGAFRGSCHQWDLATKNSFKVTFTQAGRYRFDSDGIHSDWWGHRLYWDTKVQGKADKPFFYAPIIQDVFSTLPSFYITVDSGDEILDPVIAKLEAIPDVGSLTLADETAVKEAREAYDALNDTQKALVNSEDLARLTDAEAKIEQLKKVTPTPTKKPEPKPSIRLNYTSIPLQVKQSTTAVKISKSAIKGDKIRSAKSSNSKVAKVSVKNGKLTIKGMKAGKATVTVTSAKGAKATVKVTVQKKKVALKKLQAITSRKVTVKKGKKTTLKVVNSPITAKASVKWKTSNKKVASVTSKGVVKGLKKGSATITAYSGKVKMTFKVTVK